MKLIKRYFFVFSLLLSLASYSQQSRQDVFIDDIDRFWIAYDSVQTTADTIKQIQYIKTLYTDKGTDGLKLFMKLRRYTPELWARVIRQYPKFWKSIRPNTLIVKQKQAEILVAVEQFKKIYPDYRNATIYFTVGALRSAGVAEGNTALVGMELTGGTSSIDVSEFTNKRIENAFKTQKIDNLVAVTVHEYVHTQQKEEGKTLLGQSIYEGACDFITELVLGAPLTHSYILYGKTHEADLKVAFKKEMFNADYSQWIYNGTRAMEMGDLGYFMGYTICKSYYVHATDKKKAIKDIIELPYSDGEKVEQFLEASRYYKE
jgi:hypothetical protein